MTSRAAQPWRAADSPISGVPFCWHRAGAPLTPGVILTHRSRGIPVVMSKTSEMRTSDIVTRAGREIIDGLGDLAEAGLDSSPVELILDEIPVVKTITGLYKAGLSIREGLFAKKLQDFFKAASRSSGPTKTEREQAIMNFGGEDNRQRLGESMILLLDRTEDMQKPKLLGYIIGWLMTGRIGYSDAMTLSAIVDRIIFEDLRLLVQASPYINVSGGSDFSAVHRLQSNGLMYQSIINAGGADEDGEALQGFSLTTVGVQLSEIYRNMCSSAD